MKKFFSFLLSAVLTLVCVAAVLTIGYIVFTSTEMYSWYSTEAVEEKEFGSPYKFYFEDLDNTEKHAYNEIITHIYDMPEEIEIPYLEEDRIKKVFDAVLLDNPDIAFVSTGDRHRILSRGFKTFFVVDYNMTKEEYLAQCEAVEAEVQKIISNLSDPGDEWQTELEIHDYIVDNCTYKYEADDPKRIYSSVYGVLINGQAACEGYSRTAKLLFDEVGIESALVCGDSKNSDGEEGPHMWNAVKINGDFYYLDCTWDDPVLKDGKETKLYSYFNVTTQMISKTHTPNVYKFVCMDTDENYYVKTGRLFDDYNSSYENKVIELFSEEVRKGKDEIHLKFSNKKAYKSALNELVERKKIYDVISSVYGIPKNKIQNESIGWSPDEPQLVLCFKYKRG